MKSESSSEDEKSNDCEEAMNEMSNADSSGNRLSHREAFKVFESTLSSVLESDPLLNNLPSCVTVEEVNSQIALEYGQAMMVNVHKANGEIYPIVVQQKATVQDLKQAIKRHVTLKQAREGNSVAISWRYIWRTYWLYFDGQKLTDDRKKIKDYGIRNKGDVTFIKRLKEK